MSAANPSCIAWPKKWNFKFLQFKDAQFSHPLLNEALTQKFRLAWKSKVESNPSNMKFSQFYELSISHMHESKIGYNDLTSHPFGPLCKCSLYLPMQILDAGDGVSKLTQGRTLDT